MGLFTDQVSSSHQTNTDIDRALNENTKHIWGGLKVLREKRSQVQTKPP